LSTPKHTFDPDSSGLSCDTCLLPKKHPNHDVARTPVDAPSTVVTVNQSPTAQAAGEAAALRSGTLRAKIYHWIVTRPQGATTDEVEVHLDRSHQSVSSAMNTLAGNGHIVPLVQDGREVRRDTRTGNPATVYVAASARVGVA
jgi:hypothetical protein